MIQINHHDSVVIKTPVYDELTGELLTEETPIQNEGIRRPVSEDHAPVEPAAIQQESSRELVAEDNDSVVVKAPIYDELTEELLTEEVPIKPEVTRGLVAEDNTLVEPAAIQQESSRGLVTENNNSVVVKAPIYDELTGKLLTQES